MRWHAYGAMDDECTRVLTVGPTDRGPVDVLDGVAKFRAQWAYLGSTDHEPTEADHDAYVRQVEGHG